MCVATTPWGAATTNGGTCSTTPSAAHNTNFCNFGNPPKPNDNTHRRCVDRGRRGCRWRWRRRFVSGRRDDVGKRKVQGAGHCVCQPRATGPTTVARELVMPRGSGWAWHDGVLAWACEARARSTRVWRASPPRRTRTVTAGSMMPIKRDAMTPMW